MSRAIRIFSICHNADDYRNPKHRRVVVRLEKDGDRYRWRTEAGEDTEVSGKTVAEAIEAACAAWRAADWDMRATWLQ